MTKKKKKKQTTEQKMRLNKKKIIVKRQLTTYAHDQTVFSPCLKPSEKSTLNGLRRLMNHPAASRFSSGEKNPN